MILNLNQIELIIIMGIPLLFLIMFLPALLEVRKPKDCGPRMIMDKVPGFHIQPRLFIGIENIEDETKFEYLLLLRLTKIVEVLPSLEV